MTGIANDSMAKNRCAAGRDAPTAHSRARDRRQQAAMLVLTGSFLLLALLYGESYASMVQTWVRSETFLHGFLIFPVSAYLVWRRWPVLRAVELKPCYTALPAILLVSLLWLLCDFLAIQVGKEFLAVAQIPLLVLAIAGRSFAWGISFPLGYLVFAVPFGEAAIPYLIDFTAFFTVESLQLSGIPVVREGAFFSIPAGNFEVAKACSGVRYVLASLALGTLYGYLIFHSFRKRLVFFLFALLLPIVANGIRAFGIVLLAHFSAMKVAVGIDHLIFGWIFFGLIMLLMFWAGDRFRDKSTMDGKSEETIRHACFGDVVSLGRLLPAGIVAIFLASTGPALAAFISQVGQGSAPAGLPASAGAWQAVTAAGRDWRPAYVGASHEHIGTYENNGRHIDLAVIRYDTQIQGAELANVVNSIADRGLWSFGHIAELHFEPDATQTVPIRETEIQRNGVTRLVWSWNEVNGTPVASDLETKRKEAASIFHFRRPLSAAIILSTPIGSDFEPARNAFEDFLRSSWNDLHECLYRSDGGGAVCISDDNEAQREGY